MCHGGDNRIYMTSDLANGDDPEGNRRWDAQDKRLAAEGDFPLHITIGVVAVEYFYTRVEF